MKRRKLIAGAIATSAIVSVPAVEASKKDRDGDKDKDKKRFHHLPGGRPFRILQAQIDALEERVDAGEFEQLRIESADGANRLLFGPTDDCSVEVNPQGPPGLLLRDPLGVRIAPPDPVQAAALPGAVPSATLFFGRDDLCAIQLGALQGEGLIIYDPNGVFVRSPVDGRPHALAFGEVNPDSGVAECRIEAGGDGPGGLMLRDPGGIRILPPDGAASAATVFFGPSDECRLGLGAEPGEGLILQDPNGLFIRNPAAAGPANAAADQGAAHTLSFGAINPKTARAECRIEAGGAGPEGLMLRDPFGVRILPSEAASAPASLLFGPTNECRLRLGTVSGEGLILEDPFGLFIRNPDGSSAGALSFGPVDQGTGTALCRIQAGGLAPDGSVEGMAFTDPEGFRFDNPLAAGAANVQVNGRLVADQIVQTSSGHLKENVRPIDDALDRIMALQGVYFDWKAEKGGGADLGFIGEQVDEVLPELVLRDESGGGARGVKYANMVAVVVEGVKQQQAQVQRLEEDRRRLEQEVDTLRSELADLSARVRTLVN